MKFYIASKLENAAQVCELRDLLTAAGWQITYDWTVHGSVRGPAVGCANPIRDVAQAETDAVTAAEVFIMLLPGGRGAHVEFGIAIASVYDVKLWSPQPDVDFGFTEACSAFYHLDFDHGVERCRHATIAELAAYLIAEYADAMEGA